jgi:hypothetical protein
MNRKGSLREIQVHQPKLFRWSMVVLLILSTLPIPQRLVSRVEQTSESGAFPCQAKGCGCRDAKRCWTSCCCHTPKERKEWAERNGIEPPSYAVLTETRSTKATKSCCPTKHIQSPSRTSRAPGNQGLVLRRLIQDRPIVFWEVAKCSGQRVDFWIAPPTIIEPRLGIHTQMLCDRSMPYDHLLQLQCTLAPDSPPPRWA